MIEHISRGLSGQSVVSVTKSTLGFLDQAFQQTKINDYILSRAAKQADTMSLPGNSHFDVTDILDFVVRAHASTLVVWNLQVFSPVIFTAEDFLFFLAELERRAVALVLIEDGILVSSEGGAPISRLQSLWESFKRARKRENALASRAKALERGHAVQRKRRAKPDEVFLLRSQGKSIKEIALHVNVSESAVYRALQHAERGIKKISQ